MGQLDILLFLVYRILTKIFTPCGGTGTSFLILNIGCGETKLWPRAGKAFDHHTGKLKLSRPRRFAALHDSDTHAYSIWGGTRVLLIIVSPGVKAETACIDTQWGCFRNYPVLISWQDAREQDGAAGSPHARELRGIACATRSGAHTSIERTPTRPSGKAGRARGKQIILASA